MAGRHFLVIQVQSNKSDIMAHTAVLQIAHPSPGVIPAPVIAQVSCAALSDNLPALHSCCSASRIQ